MQSTGPTVILVSPDLAFSCAVRSALERSDPSCHVALVATFAAARRTVADFSPDAIIVQESTLPRALDGGPLRCQDVVAGLASFAPVVVLGGLRAPDGLAALIAAGAVEFVADGQSDVAAAAACVERTLHSVRRYGPSARGSAIWRAGQDLYPDGFGEILRHELNNPLTGILGNAELLLSEVRRHKNLPIPEGSLQRLETIAALAVRLRETVRRLSQACESRAEQVRSM